MTDPEPPDASRDATPTDDARSAADDDAAFAAYGDALVDAVDTAIEDWVRRCVQDRCAAAGVDLDAVTRSTITSTAEACRGAVVADMRLLFSRDIDAQAGTPLQILRDAVSFPTSVLAGLGVVPVERDEFERREFPDDPYGLTPAGFGDIDASLVDPAVAWGAAKAHVHRRRHGPAAPD